MPHGLNIVLVRPEIPPNTGNVGRLCVATQSRLHLVGPMGFEITDAQVKRAGLDYWQYLNLTLHSDLKTFLDTLPPGAPLALFSKKAPRSIYDHRFLAGSYLLFGSETAGLPEEVWNRFGDTGLRIPLFDDRVRSLNLSTAVGIVVYEAIRQLGIQEG